MPVVQVTYFCTLEGTQHQQCIVVAEKSYVITFNSFETLPGPKTVVLYLWSAFTWKSSTVLVTVASISATSFSQETQRVNARFAA